MRLQVAAFIALFAVALSAQTPEYGPEKGTPVIQGGGSAEGTGIMETFVNLAGGLDAKIIIIPTAGGNRKPDGSLATYEEDKIIAPWKKAKA